jgi:[protein]-arginine 3-hydroxylase / protease
MNEKRWSTDYLRSVAGCRLVPVELGLKYTDESWSQTLITFDDFIDKYVTHRSLTESTCSVGYLAQHQLFDQIPRLRKDIAIPDYCALSTIDNSAVDDENVDINAWFGPPGTVSPLHRDAKNNLLAQVVGSKYIRLYEREATHRLYPFSSPLLETTSQVDVENPDLELFPLFAGLKFKDLILNEGEMLYIPAMHWHFVRSLSVSFSVSFWWI